MHECRYQKTKNEFLCIVCGKSLCDLCGIPKYYHVKNSESPYICEICAKDWKFILKNTLEWLFDETPLENHKLTDNANIIRARVEETSKIFYNYVNFLLAILRKKLQNSEFEHTIQQNRLLNLCYYFRELEIGNNNSENIGNFLRDQCEIQLTHKMNGFDIFNEDFNPTFIYDYLDMFFLTIRQTGIKIFSPDDITKGINSVDLSKFKIKKEILVNNWNYLLTVF